MEGAEQFLRRQPDQMAVTGEMELVARIGIAVDDPFIHQSDACHGSSPLLSSLTARFPPPTAPLERHPWERGRPARTKPGITLAISSTFIDRERRFGSPSGWPMRFPPTGQLAAASQETQRWPKEQDAGGTPALPGNAKNHSPLEGESQKPRRQAMADAVGGAGHVRLRPATTRGCFRTVLSS